MEIMVAFLVGFPFISALLHGIVKDNKARKIITYTSAGLIIFATLMFTATYYIKGGGYITFNEEFLIGGLPFVKIVDYLMVAGEVFLVALITVLSIKYKKYYAAVLSIAQTALEFWYEFSGIKPKNQISNFYCDQLTIIMILIIAIVGTFITIYACGYMDDYHHHHGNEVKDRRGFFFAIMYVFIGAMFGLVLSNNLIWLYFFWEVTSVCSFLLIGYTRSAETITNCFKALWMNLLSGLGMAVGIVMLGVNHSVTSLQGILEKNKSLIVLPIIFLSFGALTKSAQLPFSKWLLGAMVAPTPSSALLHSATMVKAGVYLLIRMAPAMSGEFSGYMLGLLGGFTFLTPFGMLVSKWAALKAFVDTGLASGNTLEIIVSTLLVLCICFGSATTLFYWSKWLATVLSSNPSDRRHKNTISINQWASLFTHGGLMILIVFVFPIISKYVVKPYTAKVFHNDYAVISYENIVLTILMVIFIFVIPIANYFLIAKNRPFPKAKRYFNGVGTPDQVGFVDILNGMEKDIRKITNVFLNDYSVQKRLKGVGILTKEDAHRLNAAGDMARASGIEIDMRKT